MRPYLDKVIQSQYYISHFGSNCSTLKYQSVFVRKSVTSDETLFGKADYVLSIVTSDTNINLYNKTLSFYLRTKHMFILIIILQILRFLGCDKKINCIDYYSCLVGGEIKIDL